MGYCGGTGLDWGLELCGVGWSDTLEWRRAGLPVEDFWRVVWISIHMVCSDSLEARLKRHHLHNHGGIRCPSSHWGRGGKCEPLDQQDHGIGGTGFRHIPELRINEDWDEDGGLLDVFQVRGVVRSHGYWDCGGPDRLFLLWQCEPGLERQRLVRRNEHEHQFLGGRPLRRPLGI